MRFSRLLIGEKEKRRKIKEQVCTGCFILVYIINPLPMCVSSFNFVSLTEKCDNVFNVLELVRKEIEEIKE